jgi:hypothetical protein
MIRDHRFTITTHNHKFTTRPDSKITTGPLINDQSQLTSMNYEVS